MSENIGKQEENIKCDIFHSFAGRFESAIPEDTCYRSGLFGSIPEEIPEETRSLNDLLDEYASIIADVTKDVKEPPFLFTYKDVGFSPLGNIFAIKAKAKQGKTQLTKVLMSASLCGQYMGIKCQKENAKILYVDTEMGMDMTILTMQSVLRMCSKVDAKWRYNEPSNRFLGVSLRTKKKDERWHIIIDFIISYRPDLVIVDGIRDLIFNHNDEVQSDEIVTNILDASERYNCAIWNILHENKGDDNMRGHLGTELVNKAFEVLAVRKGDKDENGVFKVEQTECRWKPLEEFAFVIDEYGCPCPEETNIEDFNNISTENISNVIDSIKAYNKEQILNFIVSQNNHEVRPTDIINAIMQTKVKLKVLGRDNKSKSVGRCGESKAKVLWNEYKDILLDNGNIKEIQNPNNKNSKLYRYVEPEEFEGNDE